MISNFHFTFVDFYFSYRFIHSSISYFLFENSTLIFLLIKSRNQRLTLAMYPIKYLIFIVIEIVATQIVEFIIDL